MFGKMSFGKGITYKSIDFNANPHIPLLAQINELKKDLIQVQYGDLVVMNIENYKQIMDTREIDQTIAEAEMETELMDAREVMGNLRRKHFE